MAGVSQEEFIKTVRDAIGYRDDRLELPKDHSAARVVAESERLIERFCAMVTDAKMKLYRVADASGVSATLVQILKSLDAHKAVVNEDPFPQHDTVVLALRDADCQQLDLRDRDAPFQADVGITGVRMAIAETGSIVVTSGSGSRRLASLAPPEHIAIVEKDQIVPDLLDWAASLGPDMPANEVLITGPSKTADIEMNLVMGVHGPRNVHVILIG
ncbi:MAG: lactate utilization protein [Phycisphaerae bacterium]|nr:lactate utilization protein [Phycisphaerae bacterium]